MEPSWLALAAGLTEDPIMMEGFLEYYEDRPKGSPLRKRLEETLFNELALRPHLAGDLPLFFRLLETLPPSLFASYADLLEERFPEVAGKRRNPVYRVLSVIDPDRAAKLFARSIDDASPKDVHTFRHIAENLLLLSEPSAKSLLDRILVQNASDEVFSALLPAAFRFEHPKTPEILATMMLADGGRDYSISSIARLLLNHDAWFHLFAEILNGRVFRFSEMALLFEDSAPLSEMDRIHLSDSPLNEAIALLEKHAHRKPGLLQILKSLPEKHSLLPENIVEPIAALLFAAVAHIFERKTLDTGKLSLRETISLLSTDISWNCHLETLTEHLKGFPAAEVLHAMEEAMEETRDLYGGIFLAQSMGLLAREEFIPLLVSCMDESSGDFLSERAMDALIAIGEPAGDTLVSEWSTLDSSQQIYGSSVILSVGGKALPEFLLAHIEDLYEKHTEQWCDMALAAPHPQFLPHLKSELHRNNPLVDAAYYRLCRLFGVDDPELPKLRKRIEAEERRIEEICSKDFSEIFIDPDKSSLTLSLQCQACGKSNRYTVPKVFMGDEDDEPLVSGEFSCLSCGQWNAFLIDSNGLLSINAELLRILIAKENGVGVTPLVEVMNIGIGDGFTESLPKAFRRMNERVRKNPDDWRSLHRLGNILMVLKRPRAAFECTARSYELNPDCLEIVINRILSLREYGMEREAFDLAQKALENRSRWILVSRDTRARQEEFEWLYNELIASLDLDLPEIRLVVRTLASPSGRDKIGRNDPCPCGSGKKYKKCCL